MKGIDEIGHLFHNRLMFKVGIKSITAKDYIVNHVPYKIFEPIKIFDVEVNSKGYVLKTIENDLENDENISDLQKKWIETVYDGAKKALYRANLKDLNLETDEISELETEQDILWQSILGGEGEATVIPDTSSLLDGLILRLIEAEKFDEKWDLNVYLSPTVLTELQNQAMGRQKQFDDKKNKDNKEQALIRFSEEKRKARIALRALSELVNYRNLKELKIKMIDIKKADGNVNDWNILQEAKSLQVDTPKFFITNDLIQNTLANLMGLKTKYMSPPHLLLNHPEIRLRNKKEVGKIIYELAIQYGEIIIKTKDEEIEFNLQSDWSNKLSPSWVESVVIGKIIYKDINSKENVTRIINKIRTSREKIKDFDPRKRQI